MRIANNSDSIIDFLQNKFILPDNTNNVAPSPSYVYQQSFEKVVGINSYYNATMTSLGCGYFINGPSQNYGYILTACHLILDSNNNLSPSIAINTYYPTNTIIFLDGAVNVVMGYDKNADIALLRIINNGTNFKTFDIKNSRTSLSIGDYVNVIGYAGDVDAQSMSRGIVRDNKWQSISQSQEVVLTDVSVNRGNSGGPVITDDGKAVGIVSWGFTDLEDVNAACASYLFQPVIQYFFDNYTNTPLNYPKGYMGILYNPIDFTDALMLGLSKVEGCAVFNSINPPYISANFDEGDIILSIDGVSLGVLNDQFPLFTAVHLKPPGTVVSVSYRPVGNYSTILSKNVTLTTFPPQYDFLRSPVQKFIV